MQDTNTKLDLLAASETKAISAKQLEAYESASKALGGINESLEDVVAATQEPIKPLTKKQQKQQKYMAKGMRQYMQKAQRQAQTQHIMNRLYAHSIRTPEQARQIHAAQNARAELTGLLGVRQAEAFFSAKPETRTHDFFPKVTIDANPTLMTDAQGQSRTLTQVYEYYIYKHFMLLSKAAGDENEYQLNLEVNWPTTPVTDYIAFEETPGNEPIVDQSVEGTVVNEEEQTEAA